MNSSLVPLKSRLEQGLMHIKSVVAQSHPVAVMWQFGKEVVPIQMSSLSRELGSKFRDPLAIALVLLHIDREQPRHVAKVDLVWPLGV
ncbi:hypothetical protein TNCV_4383631 [Trichonephila clavipes]|nr:hypothetical protein TNCV_4383631 [Trichonephila clavipes]